MRRRGTTWGLTWLLAVGAGCGSGLAPDPTIVPLSSYGAETAAVVCAKIFGCCDSAERMYFGYASEVECRQMMAAEVQMNLTQLVELGWVTYNPRAARSCLDEAAANNSCADVFSHGQPRFIAPSCAGVSPGAGKLGTVCEDLDLICESFVQALYD